MTIHYLSLNAVADRTGIALSTLRTYRRDGRLPEPDATIGLEPNVRHGWLPETIDNWQVNRPGRGARTDLKNIMSLTCVRGAGEENQDEEG